MSVWSWIVVWILAALVFWIAVVFNSLVAKRNRVRNAWSDIDVQLKRRYDLVPNIVEAVKGYRGHEASALERVTQARSGAVGSQGAAPAGRGPAESQLTRAVRGLFAVVENYPELRASENFRKLHDELVRLEEDIQSARRYYNASVREFNNGVEVFPANLVAGVLGFKSAEFFDVDDDEREAVKVELQPR